MSIIRISGEATCPQHEVAFIGDRDADFDAKFIFLWIFPLAMHSVSGGWGMKSVELVFVMALLSQNALGFLDRFLESRGTSRGCSDNCHSMSRNTRPTKVLNCLRAFLLRLSCLA
jgi:hypothetical protein